MSNYGITHLPKLFEVTSIISSFRNERNLTGSENIIETLPFHEFVYAENGDINILLDGEIFSLSAGCLIFYPPNSFRSIVTSRDAVLDVVCFESPSSLLSDFYGRIIRLNEPQRQLLSEIITLGKTLFTSKTPEKYTCGMVARETASPYSLQHFGALVEFFLLNLHESILTAPHVSAKIANTLDRRFALLIEHLKAHLSESVSLEEMSIACKTSISGLHRLCKKQCGTSPVSLFISLKIARAKQLISETDMNFSEVSDFLGFSSIHYFSKLFKSKTGVTPSEYKKSGGAG